MNKQLLSKMPWIIIVILPVCLEALIRIIILSFYLIGVILPWWITIQYPQKFSSLLLVVSIYFLLAWLDAVYKNFQGGAAIPKSLMCWHIEFPKYIINIPQVLGWKKSLILLSIVTVSILITWKLLLLPQIDQLSSIKSSLQSINSQVKDVSSSINKIQNGVKLNEVSYMKIFHEYSVSDISQIMSNLTKEKDIQKKRLLIQEALNKTFPLKDKCRSEMIRLGNLKKEISENQGKLKNLLNSISIIKTNKMSVCSVDSTQTESECRNLTEDIKSIESLVDSNQSTINYIAKTILLDISKSYKKISDLRTNIGKIEEQIEEAQDIDVNTINSWLSDSTNKLNDVSRQVSNYPEKKYALKFDKLKEDIDESKTTLSEIETSTEKTKNNKNLIVLFSDVNFNLDQINKVKTSFSKVRDNLDNLLKDLPNDIDSLKTLYNKAYGYSWQAHSYLNKPSIKNQKNNIKILIDKTYYRSKEITQNLKIIINEYETNLGSINNQIPFLSERIGGITNHIEYLKNKNNQIQIKSLLILLAFMAVIIIIVLIALLFVRNVWEQRQLDEQEKLNKENILNTLLECIINSNKTLRIRSYAVQKIHDSQFSLNKNEIKQIKDLINRLEKSPSSNDKIVAAKLRIVAEAHELRLAERSRL